MNSDRRQKVEELHRLLVESVEGVQSSADWQRLLDFARRFHHYSFDNQLLIAVQHDQAFRAGRVSEPLPSYVAGFRTWKAVGRSVNKGQRGYAILAPLVHRTPLAQASDATRPVGGGEEPAGREELLPGRSAVRGFTVAHVWDVSQTSGKPIPQSPRPQLLEGGAPDRLADQLSAFLARRGFTVRSVPDATGIGGANGVTDVATRTISVRADLEPAARVKTLAHEAGHALLHDPSADPGVTALALGHRGRAEVEAESVAYVLTSAYGMDPSGYSLPYVASWAGTEKPAEVVRATARRVVGAASEVLASLDVEAAGPPPGAAISLERRDPVRPLSAGVRRANEAIRL